MTKAIRNHTDQTYMSHFAYKCVSFRLHMGSYDLEGLSRIDNTVKTREFREQDWLEEPQSLVSMDSSIGDVLLTENVEDQWQQKMVYY